MFNKKGSDRRQFARVPVTDPELLPIRAEWDGGEMLAILDISYKGAAMAIPQNSGVAIGRQVEVRIETQRGWLGPIVAQVAWRRDDAMGVEFHFLRGSDRLELNRFLESKLVGLGLRPVDRKYFAPGLDCTSWFHGTGETDILLWMVDNGTQRWVAKAIFEFPDKKVIYDKGSWTSENKQLVFDDDLTPPFIDPNPQSTADRLLDMLTQLLPLQPEVKELALKLKSVKWPDDF